MRSALHLPSRNLSQAVGPRRQALAVQAMTERPVPNQTYLTAVGARDRIEETATYVNEELFAKGVINREQQHELLWGLRITFLALNTIIADTEVFVGSGRYGTRKPIDF